MSHWDSPFKGHIPGEVADQDDESNNPVRKNKS